MLFWCTTHISVYYVLLSGHDCSIDSNRCHFSVLCTALRAGVSSTSLQYTKSRGWSWIQI